MANRGSDSAWRTGAYPVTSHSLVPFAISSGWTVRGADAAPGSGAVRSAV
ncbi:hypothetical protein SVIO_018410 [Streptomyces violaceusniger]|uniref:Uncharacterized protein n=1 Tax=Streptomyces violaceusniger TaxID=68280 RepID=A0A4D4KXZ4_STRVO|nr:hypothetical protein SVIO_018410 [Streptomyces violaceusniger]